MLQSPAEGRGRPELRQQGRRPDAVLGHRWGVEIIKLMHQYGVNMDARTPKDWTPLSYSKAKGKYGATEEKGIYPEVSSPATIWRIPCIL